MRELLDYQADQIERVLASHGVPGRVYGGQVSPRIVEFHVEPAAGVKIARIEGLAEELAMYLGVSGCRVQRRGAIVSIEVPKERPRIVNLLEVVTGLGRPVPPATAVLGQDREGLPLLLRLPSPDVAHVLITGTTGSGKTELARSMILSLALCNRPDSLYLLLIDPKGRGYKAFGSLPHLFCPVISDVSEAQQRLEGLVAEMERRDKAGQSEPRVIVFVDELADMMMVGGKQMIQTMTRLTQRGREAGIHVVACTQKPTAAIVGGLVKSNFPARLVGSVPSADDARIAAGISNSGAERLAGRGDFLLVVKGEVQRLQAALTPPEEMASAVSRLATEMKRLAPALREGPHTSQPLKQIPPPEIPPSEHATRRSLRPPADPAPQPLPAPVLRAAAQAAASDEASAADQAPDPDPFLWRSINGNLRIGHRRAQ